VLAAIGFGLLIGAALGLLGGGGSIFAVPALVYGVGESVQHAVTASLFVVGLSSGIAAVPRARAGQIRWLVAAVFGVAGAGTAFAGTAVNHLLSPRVLLIAFAALMIAVAVRMLWGAVEPRGGCTAADGKVNWRGCLPKVIAAGAVVGFLTGLFGVGGGFIIVPTIALLLGLEMRLAIGTSLVVIVITSAAGLVAHLQRTSVDWRIALPFAAAAVAAALVAGRFGSRVDSDRLRRWFAWLIMAVAVFVAIEAVVNPTSLGS
jgi:uncharacterized membrane protein YfcA